jgi:hypothetical protein
MVEPDRSLLQPKRWLVGCGLWVLLAEFGIVVGLLVLFAAVEAHVSMWMVVAGAIAAIVAAAWRWRERLSSPEMRVALGVVVVAWSATALSVRWPGGIAAASHGITVVGACPIVALDVTIDTAGTLGFRPKSHRISWAEIEPLAEGAEMVLVGTGWAGAAVVDAEVMRHLGGRLEVAKTGEAIQRYRQLRAHGRRVALLAHTTC